MKLKMFVLFVCSIIMTNVFAVEYLSGSIDAVAIQPANNINFAVYGPLSSDVVIITTTSGTNSSMRGCYYELSDSSILGKSFLAWALTAQSSGRNDVSITIEPSVYIKDNSGNMYYKIVAINK